MKPILIAYATTFGTTRDVARRVAAELTALDLGVVVVDVASPPGDLDLSNHAAVIVAASHHRGDHRTEIVDFIRRHRADLARMPTLLLPLSLEQAVVEDALTPPALRAEAYADVLAQVARLVARTGWRPQAVVPLAGALPYRRYPFLLRQVMRAMAWRVGAPIDASTDHVLTDWKTVTRAVADLAHELRDQRAHPPARVSLVPPPPTTTRVPQPVWN